MKRVTRALGARRVLHTRAQRARARRDWAGGLARRCRGRKKMSCEQRAADDSSPAARNDSTHDDYTVSGPPAGSHTICGRGLEGMLWLRRCGVPD